MGCPMMGLSICHCSSAVRLKEAQAGKTLQSAVVFDMLGAALETEKGPELVKKMNAVVCFVVDGEAFTVDLKSGNGKVTKGEEGKADLTVTVSDDNFVALAKGKLNPQMAFMTGKLKLKGNMGLAMKLGPVLKAAGEAAPKPKL